MHNVLRPSEHLWRSSGGGLRRLRERLQNALRATARRNASPVRVRAAKFLRRRDRRALQPATWRQRWQLQRVRNRRRKQWQSQRRIGAWRLRQRERRRRQSLWGFNRRRREFGQRWREFGHGRRHGDELPGRVRLPCGSGVRVRSLRRGLASPPPAIPVGSNQRTSRPEASAHRHLPPMSSHCPAQVVKSIQRNAAPHFCKLLPTQ